MPILLGCFGSEPDKSCSACDLSKKVALAAPRVTYTLTLLHIPHLAEMAISSNNIVYSKENNEGKILTVT